MYEKYINREKLKDWKYSAKVPDKEYLDYLKEKSNDELLFLKIKYMTKTSEIKYSIDGIITILIVIGVWNILDVFENIGYVNKNHLAVFILFFIIVLILILLVWKARITMYRQKLGIIEMELKNRN